jgi:predicted RNase H-like HicB family nuclease
MRTIADRYEKIVYWSDEDECFIGMCPELFSGGVHGDDANAVFNELLEVVDEWVEILEKEGRPLPEPKHAELQAA